MRNVKRSIQHVALVAVTVALVFAGFGIGSAAATVETVVLGDVYCNALYDEKIGSLYIAGNETGWYNSETGDFISFTKEVGTDSMYCILDYANSAKTSTVIGTCFKTITVGAKSYEYIMNVKYPTVTITGYVYENESSTTPISNQLIGGTTTTANKFIITSPRKLGDANVLGLAFTIPEGTLTVGLMPGDITAGEVFGAKITDESTVDSLVFNFSNISKMDLGTWIVAPVFKRGSSNGFSNISPEHMFGKEYTFTVISADISKKISADADQITQGGYVTITLTAPYGKYHVGVNDAATIPPNQYNVELRPGSTAGETGTQVNVSVGTSWQQNFVIQSLTTDDITVILYDDLTSSTVKKQITIKVIAGAITATVEKNSVYIGGAINLSGTNDWGGYVYLYVKGTNYPLEYYPYDYGAGKVWDATINTSKLNHPDAGTYTIYIAKPHDGYDYTSPANTDDFDDANKFDAYTTVTIPLIQPFIFANVTSDTFLQGSNLGIYGCAEGCPDQVKLYVFGMDFFKTADISVLSNGTYTFSKKIVAADKTESGAWSMAEGEYYVVVQHRMYDNTFNIGPVAIDENAGNYDIVLNENGDYRLGTTVIFNTLARKGSNAAMALIDAIGSQNIDDMEAHTSFNVTDSAPSSASAKLSPGWNFISVPKKLSADYDTAGEFFNGVDSGDHPVLMYNAETKAWEQASASTKISSLNAYWIYSVSEKTLPYAFDTTPSLPPTKAVYEGWNAVGISAEESIEAEAAFGNTEWYSFVAWNSGKQKYYSPIIRGNSGTYAETTLVSPWVGGWLYVNSDGTYLGYA